MEELQSRMSSTEFVGWSYYLERSVNHFHREDYLFAQLAMVLVRCLTKGKPEIDDFLVKFKVSEPVKPLTPEERAQRSKAFWLAALGLSSKKK